MLEHLPDALERARYAAVRIRQVRLLSPLWRERGIVFVHVPKAAGTSINLALYGAFTGHPRAAEIRRFAPRDIVTLPFFSVVRNPWDRLVSAYRFARAGRGDGSGTVVGIRNPQHYSGPEFSSFETFVLSWLRHRDVSKLDNVFQPQWKFICDSRGKIIVDFVGRYESLRETREFLSDKLKENIDIPMSNRAGEKVDYRSYYSSRCVDAVTKIYNEDIRLLGYSFGA